MNLLMALKDDEALSQRDEPGDLYTWDGPGCSDNSLCKWNSDCCCHHSCDELVDCKESESVIFIKIYNFLNGRCLSIFTIDSTTLLIIP